jgi:hypothetical protein
MTRRVALLLSYHFWKTGDLAAVRDAFEEPPVVFADSGAFSAASAGAVIRLPDYADWLDRWRPYIDVACTLDVIGNAWATRQNTDVLAERGHTTLPVFHVGEPYEELEAWCRDYRFVGLGGMVPYANRRGAVARWLVRCFQIARPHGTVFHGLGQTNWRTLAELPFYSVDSSSWASGDRYGYLALWDDQRHRLVSFNAGGRSPQRVYPVGRLFRAHGLEPAAYSDPHYGRQSEAKDKPTPQLRAERAQLREANLRAWLSVEDWMRARHGPITAPGLPDGGWVFLVCMNREHVDAVASWVRRSNETPDLVVGSGRTSKER